MRPGRPGGADNGRVAAIAGLGVSRECYVGIDRTIEFSMMMPEQFTCHDLDLTERTGNPADTTEAGWDALLRMSTRQLLEARVAGGRRADLRGSLAWIDARKDKHWMGFNECCAYLHAAVGEAGTGEPGFELRYDDPYCRSSAGHPSAWTLELSDRLLQRGGAAATVRIDGRQMTSPVSARQEVRVPAGLGRLIIEVYAAR